MPDQILSAGLLQTPSDALSQLKIVKHSAKYRLCRYPEQEQLGKLCRTNYLVSVHRDRCCSVCALISPDYKMWQ